MNRTRRQNTPARPQRKTRDARAYFFFFAAFFATFFLAGFFVVFFFAVFFFAGMSLLLDLIIHTSSTCQAPTPQAVSIVGCRVVVSIRRPFAMF